MSFADAIIKLRSERRISQKRACGGFECELRNGKPLGERKNRSE